ncbi:fasciclin domain-containing protein [Maribacter sp. 2307ULW6-5]|uniref:fasciclin domain-containing protein n=1 Tax=Maribacter sp. 2307ULW6-5 TaxID=3386275 RepID=UPI0039BD616C
MKTLSQKHLKQMALFAVVLTLGCGEQKKENTPTVANEVQESLSLSAPNAPDTTSDMKNVVDVVMSQVALSTLEKGLKSTQLVAPLQDMGALTLFAPTNAAFGALPEEKVRDLMKPQGKAELTDLLKYHVLKGTYDTATLLEKVRENNGSLALETLQGTRIHIVLKDNRLMLRDEMEAPAYIEMPNMQAQKGVVHGIDKVLFPNF